MACAVFYHVIAYRQMHERSHSTDPEQPPEGIIFKNAFLESVDYQHITPIIKCLFNYTFYKLGLELCLCATIVTACIRADAVSILYILLFLIFLLTPRSFCCRLWPAYMSLLGVLLPLQYVLCVGIPKNFCKMYPWEQKDKETQRLLRWLYLPTSNSKLESWKLFADFFQYLFVAMQYRVFLLENQDGPVARGGGSNKPDLRDSMVPNADDKDFVSSKDCYLDYLLHAVFYWSYWVSLAIVFLTGITSVSLFCLGYIILSFIYLWMGQNVMLNPRKLLIRSWNLIICYNVSVILTKCVLQYLSCVKCEYIENKSAYIHLLGLNCINSRVFNSEDQATSTCKFNIDAEQPSGLNWDVFCFIIIIFQRKIFLFKSFIFVQGQFASRGAYLINGKLMLMIERQNCDEKNRLKKVKEKIARIAMRQRAFRESADRINEHYMLLRSGDYYMFEADPEEEDDYSSYVHDLKTRITRLEEKKAQVDAEKPLIQTTKDPSSSDSAHLQHHCLQSAWSRGGDRPVMNFLGNYTDPYANVNLLV
ncbi:hypothetical protein Ciccas_000217 [Cichlidogyrus casuarinus]|uniref:Piezo TM25-28 domain-containing protein n=1 Tax=Cichlidogyrus casuarinus TaxID=1844966 RepID=A0ABD2QRI7_9PLAT